MKKILLPLFSIGIISVAAAQQAKKASFVKAPAYIRNMAKTYDNHKLTGFEALKQLTKKPNSTVMAHNKAMAHQTVIGGTTYDLQSNASVSPRTVNLGNGNIFATWTYSNSGDITAADRGSGYNDSMAGTWGAIPTARLENVRTGWSNLSIQTNGQENVIAHVVSGGLHFAHRATAGSGAWTDDTIPTNTATTMLWPRAAVGGTNGQTIHVIALTEPVANQGTAYKGLDGALLYYRSQDGGTTWDIIDSIIPGTGSPTYSHFTGDAYAIAAKGDTVAIAVFNTYAPSFLLKSTNNGDTWTKTTFLTTGLATNYDPTATGSISDTNSDAIADTITSTDEAGAILIDNSGIVHITFGEMRWLDTDPSSGAASSFFPGTSGLLYWDETMPVDSVRLIADALDLNGNQQLDIDTPIALYYTSLTGFPSMGISSNGSIFVTYSGLVENLSTGSQNYRHIYAIKSDDDGTTWTSPTDLNYGFIDNFNECVFACLAKNVDDKLHIVFQRDGEPGLAVRGDMDPYGINDIVYLGADTSALGDTTLSIQKLPKSIGGIHIFPNPASDNVNLTFNVNNPGEVNVDLYNILGKKIAQIENKNTQKGTQTITFNVSHLPSGVYFVKVKQAAQVETRKIIVQ